MEGTIDGRFCVGIQYRFFAGVLSEDSPSGMTAGLAPTPAAR
jgi:hypothetical protein